MSVDPDDDLPVLTDVIVAGRPPRRLPDPPAARLPAPATQGLADELTALAWNPIASPAPPAPHPGTPPPDTAARTFSPDLTPDPAPDPAPRAAPWPTQPPASDFDRAFAAARAVPEDVVVTPPAPHPGAWGDADTAPLPALTPDVAATPDTTDLPDWLSLPVRDEGAPEPVPEPAAPAPAAAHFDHDLPAPDAAPIALDPAPLPFPQHTPDAPDAAASTLPDWHRDAFAQPAPEPGDAPAIAVIQAEGPIAPNPDATPQSDANTATAAIGAVPTASATPAPGLAPAAPAAPAPGLAAADLDALAARLTADLDAQIEAATKALRSRLRADIQAQVRAAAASLSGSNPDPDAPR